MTDQRDTEPFPDPERDELREKETITNDAVAGETILPGAGEGNNGPTGGSPTEVEPILDEHDPKVDPSRTDPDDIDLDEDGDQSGA